MKNITITVDDALALQLRIAAAKADKSLSKFLAETLARTLALEHAPAQVARRIGAAAGQFEIPDSIDGLNAEIAALFHGVSTSQK